MDRKGQVWHYKSTVLAVVHSEQPTPARRYWLHSVLYLEHSMPRYVGTRHDLEEGFDSSFEALNLRRIA